MRQIYKNVERDGSGVVKLMCDEAEDMWHLYNIIRVGDKVRSKTLRKVLNESATGSKTSQRIQLTLEVEIEAIDYDPSASSIHLRGKNVLANEHVRLGAYHTVDLELNRPFSLWKPCWDSIDFERLDEALDSGKNADVAAVIMHEGFANVCVLTSTMTIVKAKVDMAIARKRKGFTGQHDKAIIKFLDAVAQAFLRHINLEVMKCVIVASRGFLKDQFMSHLFEVADKQGKKITSADKSKFVVLHSSSGFKHALKEVLSDPAVANRLADTKAQAEVKALNQFLELLNADSSKAFYGFKHVTKANEKGAIDTLMLSDALFRSNDVAQRKQYIELCDSVRSQGGTVLIFSSMHISGEQLNQITGVAAILRFPLPEVENDEDEDDEDLEADNGHLTKMFGDEIEEDFDG